MNSVDTRVINSNLEGDQKDCPKGDVVKKIINSDLESEEELSEEELSEEELSEELIIDEEKKEKQKRILKEVCRRILFRY